MCHKNRPIDVNLSFASEIEVKTWDKSTVYFKADISTKEGKFLEAYSLDIIETASSITIESEAEGVFKKLQDEWNRNHPSQKKRYYNTGDWYEFNYVLYVPKNAKFKVSSINGDFTAELINGDIDIKKYAGDLDLSTINGEIDVRMVNTKMVAETIHGNIYADEKLTLKTTDRHVGQKVEGRFDNASNNLRLNTINGNMYLRL